MATKTDIIISGEDGRMYLQECKTWEATQAVKDLLKKDLLADMCYMSQNIASFPELSCPAAHLLFYTKPGESSVKELVAFQLNSLCFHATWELQDDGFMRPTFLNQGPRVNPAAEEFRNLSFNVPDFAALWFAMDLHNNTSYLFARLAPPQSVSANSRTVIIPLPNVFGDSRTCNGTQSYPSELYQRPVLDQAKVVLQFWMEAPWNNDLYDSSREAACKTLLKWTPDGAQVQASHEDWWRLCNAVAPENMGVQKFLTKMYGEDNEQASI